MNTWIGHLNNPPTHFTTICHHKLYLLTTSQYVITYMLTTSQYVITYMLTTSQYVIKYMLTTSQYVIKYLLRHWPYHLRYSMLWCFPFVISESMRDVWMNEWPFISIHIICERTGKRNAYNEIYTGNSLYAYVQRQS